MTTCAGEKMDTQTVMRRKRPSGKRNESKKNFLINALLSNTSTLLALSHSTKACHVSRQEAMFDIGVGCQPRGT